MSKFYVTTNVIDNYRFTFKTADGRKLLHGAGFYSKATCLQGIAHVKSYADNAGCFLRKGGENKRFYFVLQSEKGKPLAVSEMYNTYHDMEAAINTVKEQAAKARIIEEN